MHKVIKTTILTSLMALSLPALAVNNNTINTNDKAKIEEIVHQYLLRKPEVLVEVMQILQKRQFEEAEQAVKKTQQSASNFAPKLFHEANDPVAGNPNGAITITEFFDYQCGHCVEMVPVMDAIIKANSDVRVIYKEFPIRGPVSEFASRAALAANKQGKYKEFSHALLNAHKPLTEEFVLSSAKDVGLNVDQLRKDMDSDAIKKQLEGNMDLGKQLKLFGTPALFISKTDEKAKSGVIYTPGQMSESQLQGAIDQVKKS